MAIYPIKMLRDEEKNSFMPFTSANAVADATGATMQELMDSGKYKIQNNVTTAQAGKGILDAYQGKLLNDKFNNYIPNTKIGAANGVASLDGEGKVPTSQLPSYVDDVIESYIRTGATALSAQWLSLTDGGAALTPEKGKIYLIMTAGSYQNKQYRWGGSTYVLCNPSDVNSVNGFTGVVTLKSLTIQKNGTQVGDTFNGSVDKTINLSIPTKTSDVTNDSGFITAADDITGNAATATNATNDGNGNNIVNTYVPKAGDVTITGTKTFSSTGGFKYSGIETATTSQERPVWFAKNNANGTPVVNASQFTYNPGTDTLKVGNITGNISSATKLKTARKIDGVNFDGSADIIHYGTCSTAAATADKTVSCTGFNLTTGAVIYVRFTVTNTAAVGNLTLNVNSTGAKSIKYRNGNINSAGNLAANRTYCFIYDGTYYQLVGDLDTNDNTYDRIKYPQSITAGSAGISSGNIIVGDSTGIYSHLKTGNAFDITKPILYAAGNLNANATGNNNYLAFSISVTTTQSITLTVDKVVYIKGNINGKIFTPISTTPLTQTEPTSADGYEYILLGRASTTTSFYLEPYHPIYAYTGGKFTRINGNEITNLSVSGRTITYTRADNSTGTITTQDTVYTLPIASASDLGGVKVGTGLSINTTSGVLDVTGIGVTAEHVEWSGVLNKPTKLSQFTNDSGYITLANVMGGATATTAGTAGVVPAPGSGKQASFLRGDGQWAGVEYATAAGKATNDGSGNSIENTYLKKSGGTMTGAITFADATNKDLTWSGGTYQQKIAIVDDANANTAVFEFKQSTDSGSTWPTLMTIKDDGEVVATKFTGALNGNAATATKASQDGSGNIITDTYVKKAGDTMTGTLVAPIIQTGTAATNYFQSQKFRGQGDASSYQHALDFGYAGHNQWDFYEYGGIFNFHKHTAAAVGEGDTLLGTINSNGWEGNVKGNVTGNLTGLASKATGDKNGLDITNYIKGLSANGTTITYTKGDNTTGTVSVSYSLPVAGVGTGGSLGGIRVGSGLSIDSTTGVLSATGGGTADSVEWSGVLNKPTKVSYWTNDVGYTTNTGTITGVSINGTSVATSGVANITSMPASILTGAIPSAVTGTTQTAGDSSTKLATTAFVQNAISDASGAMVFKGTIGTNGTAGTALPTTGVKVGDTYKIITAGTYAGQAAKAGDLFIATATTPTWAYVPSGDEGNGTVTSVTIKATGPIAIDSSSAITTSGTRTISHSNSGVTAGTYRSVTVNATGHVTAGTNPTTLSGYGITDAKIASGVITLGSNTITPLTASSTLDATKLSGTIPAACYTDTKYAAGTGLSLNGTTFNHSNSVTAGTAGTSSATSGSTVAVPYVTYDAQGHVTASGTHTHTITGFSTTDTKNTAGSTDTSSKIFLIGATSQAANPQTYSDNEVYVTSGVLTTKSVQVGGTAATMQYNSTDKCIEFVFA